MEIVVTTAFFDNSMTPFFEYKIEYSLAAIWLFQDMSSKLLIWKQN